MYNAIGLSTRIEDVRGRLPARSVSPFAGFVVNSGSATDRQERISWWQQSILASANIGIVGAGGIGLQLAEQIRVLEWQKVSFLILLILIEVTAIDWITRKLRFANKCQRAVD